MDEDIVTLFNKILEFSCNTNSIVKNNEFLLKNLANRLSLLEQKVEGLNVHREDIHKKTSYSVGPGIIDSQGEPNIHKEIKENKQVIDLHIGDEPTAIQKAFPETKNALRKLPGIKSGVIVGEFIGDDKVEKFKKQTTIRQKLLYPDQSLGAILLAKILIHDEKGEKVSETSTNAEGIFMTKLKQGDYTVFVEKGMSGKRPEVRYRYSISVPESKGTYTLNDEVIG